MATKNLPKAFRKLMVVNRSLNFREAVNITTVPVTNLAPNEILIRNKFLGVNASDIIRTAGGYDPTEKLPFPVGFEGVGTVVATGEAVTKYKYGQHVVYLTQGAYAEYIVIALTPAAPSPVIIKDLLPDYLAVAAVSGLTAKIALDKVGDLKAGETVLVTAAAGGTGQFAVQFSKQKGCHVIGTCSSKEKETLLKSLGCDRVVNYKEENLQDVLKKEYPNGIDVVYESIGKEMFTTALSSLAIGGRLIVIGFISGYKSGTGPTETDLKHLPSTLLWKSASVRGFFLLHFSQYINKYMNDLVKDFENSSNEIKTQMDSGHTVGGPFSGLEGINNAIDHLHSGKNVGKVYVTLE